MGRTDARNHRTSVVVEYDRDFAAQLVVVECSQLVDIIGPVVVSKKWHEIDTLLLHTTNRKYHIAYLFMPFPMTLDDLEGHSPNAGLVKCNSTNICATFSTV